MVTEQQKHLNKIKFYATKWKEYEDKSIDIIRQIKSLELELEQAKKDAKLYATKTRGSILLEVI